MRGSDVTLLQKLIAAAGDWRKAGTTVGVTVYQINATMPDGNDVVLFWDSEAADWNVST